jgi:hypothetical protein
LLDERKVLFSCISFHFIALGFTEQNFTLFSTFFCFRGLQEKKRFIDFSSENKNFQGKSFKGLLTFAQLMLIENSLMCCSYGNKQKIFVECLFLENVCADKSKAQVKDFKAGLRLEIEKQ